MTMIANTFFDFSLEETLVCVLILALSAFISLALLSLYTRFLIYSMFEYRYINPMSASEFSRERVYAILRTIPSGKVITYGQLAKLAGNPRAARAVGLYMRTNPDAPHTPCHRVVATDGSLHGYSGPGGIQEKKQLLIREGVTFTSKRADKVDLAQSGFLSNSQNK